MLFGFLFVFLVFLFFLSESFRFNLYYSAHCFPQPVQPVTCQPSVITSPVLTCQSSVSEQALRVLISLWHAGACTTFVRSMPELFIYEITLDLNLSALCSLQQPLKH